MAVDERLQTIRHSCAHVMAEAILKLFPGTKIAIGPAIENGFYYDFDFPTETKFSETDFTAVEKEMRKIISGNHDFVRKEITKAEGLKIFADIGFVHIQEFRQIVKGNLFVQVAVDIVHCLFCAD